MRQAIVIQNPKWEPFSAASDAFLKLKLKESDSAILVVRGRCKERKVRKGPGALVKKQPESIEALAADLKKAGRSADEIKAAVAASKLPSVLKSAAKAAAVIAMLFLLATPAVAQQSIVGNLPATTIVGSTTNTSGGNGFIGWNIDAVAVVQLAVACTNYAGSNVRVWFDTSDNGTDWVTAQYAVTGNTNTAIITRITNSVGGKYLRVGNVENVNTNTITIPRFTISVKGS